MVQFHNYSIDELENMIPWERQIYLTLLTNYVKEQNAKHERQQQQQLGK